MKRFLLLTLFISLFQSAQGDTMTKLSLYANLQQTKSNITISPVSRIVAAPKEDFSPLEFPMEIKNGSSDAIEFRTPHEVSGGEWPTSDIYAVVIDGDTVPSFEHPNPYSPVFVAGVKKDDVPEKKLMPGKSVRVNLRLDWAGTGSVKTMPLIYLHKHGVYVMRLILVFKRDGKWEHTDPFPYEIKIADAEKIKYDAWVPEVPLEVVHYIPGMIPNLKPGLTKEEVMAYLQLTPYLHEGLMSTPYGMGALTNYSTTYELRRGTKLITIFDQTTKPEKFIRAELIKN